MSDATKFGLKLEKIGQINEANISFGDLTVLVGPQATGKSIALQLLKLIIDTGHVFTELKKYGLDWSRKLDEFLDIYLGEGMRRIWREGESAITWQNEKKDLVNLVRRVPKSKLENMFYNSCSTSTDVA